MRCFRHINGFVGKTNFLYLLDGEIWLRYKLSDFSEDENLSDCYSLNECERFVKEGVWVEFEQELQE